MLARHGPWQACVCGVGEGAPEARPCDQRTCTFRPAQWMTTGPEQPGWAGGTRLSGYPGVLG